MKNPNNKIDTKWCRAIRIMFENSIWQTCVKFRNESPTRSMYRSYIYILYRVCLHIIVCEPKEEKRKKVKKSAQKQHFNSNDIHIGLESLALLFLSYVVSFYRIRKKISANILCAFTTMTKYAFQLNKRHVHCIKSQNSTLSCHNINETNQKFNTVHFSSAPKMGNINCTGVWYSVIFISGQFIGSVCRMI